MVKCPFCGFENEEGALFCEQCKSDLGTEPTPPSPPGSPTEPLVETVALATAQPLGEAFPVAAPFTAAPDTEPAADIPVAAPMAAEPASPVATEAAPEAPTAPSAAPPGMPSLVVVRGLKMNTEYPIYPGENFIGRVDEKPVDIDLEDQEPPDRVWSSRQHACIIFDEATREMTIEDLNSSNGTFVNRTRVYPGQKRPLNANDVIQIGTVHLKVKV
jgi:hypothetical protein